MPAAPLLILRRALDGDASLHQPSMRLVHVVDLDVDLEAVTG
jgi:hypothetical protein